MTQDFTVRKAEERWWRWLQEKFKALNSETEEFWTEFYAARGIAPGTEVDVDWKAMTFTMKMPEGANADPTTDA